MERELRLRCDGELFCERDAFLDLRWTMLVISRPKALRGAMFLFLVYIVSNYPYFNWLDIKNNGQDQYHSSLSYYLRAARERPAKFIQEELLLGVRQFFGSRGMTSFSDSSWDDSFFITWNRFIPLNAWGDRLAIFGFFFMLDVLGSKSSLNAGVVS